MPQVKGESDKSSRGGQVINFCLHIAKVMEQSTQQERKTLWDSG